MFPYYRSGLFTVLWISVFLFWSDCGHPRELVDLAKQGVKIVTTPFKFNRKTGVSTANVTLVNRVKPKTALVEPLDVVVTLRQPGFILANASGQTVAGAPFLRLLPPSVGLKPGKSLKTKLQFIHPNRQKFKAAFASFAIYVNHTPEANAGAPSAVFVGNNVALDGSNSADPDEDSLTFQWELISKPAGSIATLIAAENPISSFTADVPGIYQVQLIVKDGIEISQPDTVTIAAAPAPVPYAEFISLEPDTGLSSSDFETNDNTPTLHGIAGPDVIRVAVYRNGVFLPPAAPVSNGRWAYAFKNALADGNHDFTAVGENASGEQIAHSAPRTVKVDTTPPKEPSMTGRGYGENQIYASGLPGQFPPADVDEQLLCFRFQPEPFQCLPPEDEVKPDRAELREINGNFDQPLERILGPYPVIVSGDGVLRIQITDPLAPDTNYYVKFLIEDTAGNESCVESEPTKDSGCALSVNSKGMVINRNTSLFIADPTTECPVGGRWNGRDTSRLSVSIDGGGPKTVPKDITVNILDEPPSWCLKNPPESGAHDVAVTYTYTNQMWTETTDPTPTLTGVWSGDDPNKVSVKVDGIPYNKSNGLTIEGTRWHLTIPGSNELLDGDYEVLTLYGEGEPKPISVDKLTIRFGGKLDL